MTVNRNRKTETFTLLHLNVQSITGKTHLLELAVANIWPNFLCLTETWTNEFSVGAIQIQGLSMVAQFSRSQHKHGGVAIMVDGGVAEHCTEIKWVNQLAEELHFECSGMLYKGTVCIVVVYRSSNSREFDFFFTKFEHLISIVVQRYKTVIVCGDLNINGGDADCKQTKRLNDILESYGLNSHIKEPTRYANGRGSQLDYIMSNLGDIREAEVRELGISDHTSQSIVWEKTEYISQVNEREFVSKRCYTSSAVDEFKHLLNSELFLINNDEINNVDNSFNKFWSHFIWCFEVCFPRKWVSKPKTNKFEFRYSRELRQAGENLKFLNWVKKQAGGEKTKLLYDECKKQLNRNILSDKGKFYSSLIEDSQNKNRTFWQIVNKYKINNSKKKHSKKEDSLRNGW